MLSHLLQGACGHANKATPAVPDPCLDHLLSDATTAFVTTLILWHPRPADQTFLYSGLTNEILISPPLLL